MLMRKLGVLLSACALTAVMAWGFVRPASAAPADEEAITGLEHKLANAPNAQEAMKYYDPTDELTVFDMGGPSREYAGQKAVRADFEKAFAGVKNVKVQCLELKVVTDGELALARSVQHFTATGPDGKPVEIPFRES